MEFGKISKGVHCKHLPKRVTKSLSKSRPKGKGSKSRARSQPKSKIKTRKSKPRGPKPKPQPVPNLSKRIVSTSPEATEPRRRSRRRRERSRSYELAHEQSWSIARPRRKKTTVDPGPLATEQEIIRKEYRQHSISDATDFSMRLRRRPRVK